jgi:hypothetical protein
MSRGCALVTGNKIHQHSHGALEQISYLTYIFEVSKYVSKCHSGTALTVSIHILFLS